MFLEPVHAFDAERPSTLGEFPPRGATHLIGRVGALPGARANQEKAREAPALSPHRTSRSKAV